MLDTPENREHFIARARKEKLGRVWRRAWFALAVRDGKHHFVVRAQRISDGLGSFFNKSGVPGKDFGLEVSFLAGEAELRAAGFVVENFDGTDRDLEIHAE